MGVTRWIQVAVVRLDMAVCSAGQALMFVVTFILFVYILACFSKRGKYHG